MKISAVKSKGIENHVPSNFLQEINAKRKKETEPGTFFLPITTFIHNCKISRK